MVDTPTREQLAKVAGGDHRLLIALESLFETVADVRDPGDIDNLAVILDNLSTAGVVKEALNMAVRSEAKADLAVRSVAAQSKIPQFPAHRSNAHVVDYIDFNRLGPHVTQALRMQWNNDDGTVDVGLNDTVTLQIGQEMHYYAKNTSGGTISNGSPVVASGVVGSSGKLTIAPAIGDGTYDTRYYIGVATEDIANNAFGYVSSFGLVRGFDTSAWTDGDLLYVSDTTAGSWTTTAPSAPNWHQSQAIVINASSGGSGSIFSRRSSEHKLTEIQDIDLTGLADGDLIQWDATNNIWVPITGASGSFTAGSGETITVTNGVITSIV
ncbi:MAG: hypothetical protein EP341_00860 [Sphingomonadales bacterium]|nr:MAG: hypothetical protein EP341_00860 [Sphingomonadales bacterium]